ncbi:MAG TPA: pilus assembly protein N-terminal domain-containing protein, partial [Caulobacteraceae bacterium]|nr:pilus assembly protein N-terminal domain-containing protein [Caulobacteraceae bacterium]
MVAALLIASLSQAAFPALARAQPSFGPQQVNLGSASGATQNLTIPRGRSAIVDLPVDARDVLVTNPEVADAVLRSPRRIYVMGLAPGATDAAFFDASGRRILALNIRVDQDFGAVAQTINQLMPDAHVRVAAVNTSLVLTGDVRDLAEADRAVQIAQQFTSNPAQVLNMMTIDSKDQVMLKVRIVEMQRSVVKQLGFNLNALLGQVGSPQFIA